MPHSITTKVEQTKFLALVKSANDNYDPSGDRRQVKVLLVRTGWK